MFKRKFLTQFHEFKILTQYHTNLVKRENGLFKGNK